jgi:diguanylate cyclase (GGDEF)-like protein/PAS domain S-box-containing protein
MDLEFFIIPLYLISIAFIGLIFLYAFYFKIKKAGHSSFKYRSLFNWNSDGVVYFYPDGRIHKVNSKAEALLGFQEEELKFKDWRALVDQATIPVIEENVGKVISGIGIEDYEVTLISKSGQSLSVLMKHIPILVDAKMSGIFTVFKDISLQKQLEEQYQALAYTDQLTGIANRRAFEENLEILLEKQLPFSLFYLDFDRFKWINDQLSHRDGDTFLKEASRIMSLIIPEDCFLARLGGDEFAMILPDVQRSEVELYANRLRQEFLLPFHYEGSVLQSTLSIGIAMFPIHGENTEELLHHADQALYKVKEKGGNGFHIYQLEQLRIEAIERGLRFALKNDELQMVYQPKMNLGDLTVLGAEALMRWNHPKLGSVPPVEFIPIAERKGFIQDMTFWAIKTSCKEVKEIGSSGFPPFYVAVNLSPQLLKIDNLDEKILCILEEIDFPASHLILEITETALIENLEQSKKMLNKLIMAGIRIAMDDFGTGFSSLNSLRHLPISVLKIDKSFVSQLHDNVKDVKIVNTIIDLAKTMNFKVLAEGIENEKQLAILSKMNCDYGQGYYFSMPLPIKDLLIKINILSIKKDTKIRSVI